MSYFEEDLSSLTIHINELRARFNDILSYGGDFDEAKRIYIEIKELLIIQRTLHWRANDPASFFRNSVEDFENVV